MSAEATDFIGVYPGAVEPEFCQRLMEKFDASDDRQPGRAGPAVNRTKKLSTDINITGKADWAKEGAVLASRTLRGLVRYVRQHPFLLAGATSLARVDEQTGERVPITHEQVEQAPDGELAKMITLWYRLGTINLQKYDAGEGHYRAWHSEVAPSPADGGEALHRVLLWMYYLNDVDEGGETSFYFQDRRVTPRQGTLVIAPAGFTHTHRAEVPRSGDKYIATSWVLFRRQDSQP